MNARAASTSPCTTRRCCAGSIAGTPAWLRSKTRPLGVIVPLEFASGVKFHDESFVGVRSVGTLTTFSSNGDGSP